MRVAALGFASGVLVLQQQAALPSDAQWSALVVAGAVLAAVALRFRAGWGHALLIAMLAAVLGLGWSALLAELRLADALAAELEGRDVVVTGVIASLPQPFDRGVRFEFDVESPVASPGDVATQVPRHLQLAWYNGMDEEAFQLAPPVRASSCLTCVAKASRASMCWRSRTMTTTTLVARARCWARW